MKKRDREFMKIALEEAKAALAEDEVPVGAVIVLDDEIIACSHNKRESLQDPTAHAEILAIQRAAKHLKSWRLIDCTIYITKEPCPMCAGAIFQARLKRLVYGAADSKAGAAGTLFNLVQDKRLNHWVEVTSGICEQECQELLREFFRERR